MTIQHKLLFYNACRRNVEERISIIQSEIAAASASANDDTKSSAGDKHETGRAMAHLEIEKRQQQLAHAYSDLSVLEKISVNESSRRIRAGSLVITDAGNFFILIAAGKVNADGESCHIISPASPLGKQLVGKSEGESVEQNGKRILIVKVF